MTDELQTLELRLTHKYVGTHKGLDEWKTIGSFREISRISETDDSSDYENTVTTINVRVQDREPGLTIEQIAQALADHYTNWGCAHEHDCCGCRLDSATAVCTVNGWTVTQNSSRNY